MNLDTQLNNLIINSQPEEIVSSLLTLAKQIDIAERALFEQILLKLAQQKDFQEKRQYIYEVLVSLQTTFKKNPLKCELSKTFWDCFREKNYEQAAMVLEALERQFIDINLKKDTSLASMIPVNTDEHHLIAHFLDQEIILLHENFDNFDTIKIPHKGEIKNVYPCPNDCLWILIDDPKVEQSIFSYALSKKKFQCDPIQIPVEMGEPIGITHSHDFIVLFSNHSIYYYDLEKNSWKQWYKTKKNITSIQSIDNNLWVIIDESELFIFELAGFEGVRKKITLSEEIENLKGICSHQRYRGVFGANQLLLYDRGSTSPFKYLSYQANILHAAIIEDKIIATMHGNGVFEGRDIKDESKLWEIDLGESFQLIFKLANKIFLLYPHQKVLAFEIPNTQDMKKQLADNYSETVKPKEENLPRNPVRNLNSFLGREQILEEILEHPKTHMLIHGNPKMGKTSLLNVIPELLISTSRCCKIDAVELFENNTSIDEFKIRFFIKCLSQHLLDFKKEFLDTHRGFNLFIQAIKRDKRFSVFCFDGFPLPDEKDKIYTHLQTFFVELYSHPDVRLFFVCSKLNKKSVEEYLRKIKNSTTTKKEFKTVNLAPYPSDQEKTILRTITSYKDKEITNLKELSQGFPHLVHLLLHDNRWKEGIYNASQTIAKDYHDLIFQYFRDLDGDARLFLMFLFFKKWFEKKIELKEFYYEFPLIKEFFDPEKIEAILRSIQDYEESFQVNTYKKKDTDNFQFFLISMNPAPNLFFLGAQHILEAHLMDDISHFMRTPNQELAGEIVENIHRLIDTEIESDAITTSLEDKYKDKFFIRRLTSLGQQTLGMPLDTYIIITLTPWGPAHSRKQLENLYRALQVKITKTIKVGKNAELSQKFYIVLMVFDGSEAKFVKKEIKSLNRVSIIDTKNMKEILLAKDHRVKTRETIFNQLSIEERSPYTTSGAVQDLFYGRELEIALIRGLPENIGIFGTRTIGKTSLLLKLNRDLNSQGNCKVYLLDCARIDSDKALLKNLAEKMKISFEEIGSLDLFRKYISEKAEKEEKQYIFLLDEVDRLVEYDLEHGEYIFNTFNKLCSETLKTGGIAARFVLVGFQQMYKQMRNPKSRLYNFMLFLPLRALDKKSALELVSKPMRKIHINWQDEENDAAFLVDNCSGHPLLLQQACHSLLSILDSKTENKSTIERKDIERALTSEPFQRLLMRFYHFPGKTSAKKKLSLWELLKTKKWNIQIPLNTNAQEKLNTAERNLHRLTVLCAVMLLHEGKNDRNAFSLSELLAEITKNSVEISPDNMREILDFLCLRGVFRQIGEPTMIYKSKGPQAEDMQAEIKKLKSEKKFDSNQVKLGQPEVFEQDEQMQFKSCYEFGVKIFPQLLETNFDGIENCRKEMENLAGKIRNNRSDI
jgi:Cdc6-like AAA superfamily ATPase